MATHTYHPDSHTNGLADDCPRCAEHAEHPVESLDAANLLALWERMIEVEYGDGAGYRSATEVSAARSLRPVLLFLERYTPIDPRELLVVA